MGGFGSGRQSGRTETVNSSRRIDIRLLKKRGWLKSGYVYSLHWNVGGTPSGDIKYRAEPDALVLMFRYRESCGEWQSVEQRIDLASTPCNYGGYRRWLVCPHCWRRCAVLCGAGKLFLCRKCYQLPYQSQREDTYDRLLAKHRKLKELLYGENSPRMWNSTRKQLMTKLEHTNYLVNREFVAMYESRYGALKSG